MSIFFEVLRAVSDMRAEDMPSAHRLVLLMVANHANATGRAWPSLGTLRDETGFGRTKLAEVLAELVTFGWLIPDGREGRGLKASARFEVTIGRPWPPSSRAHLARPVEAMNASRDPRGGQRSAGQSDPPCGTERSAVREIGPVIRAAGHGDPPIVIRAAEDGDPRGGHKPPSNLPFEPPKELPTCAPAQLDLLGEAKTVEPDPPPKPKKVKTAKKAAAPVPDLQADELTPAERAAHDAIAADVTLRHTCRNVPRLARDLVARAPRVDVALQVVRAGGWLRAKQERRPNGNNFLTNWVDKQEREAVSLGVTLSLAPPAKPDPFAGRTRPAHIPPGGPPRPKFIQEDLERADAAKARGETVPEPRSAEDVIAKLAARMTDWSISDAVEAS